MATTKANEIPDADFSTLRQGIPTLPVNNIPPYSDGVTILLPNKYDFAAGVCQDPWGDGSTDLKMVPGSANKPQKNAGAAAMGGKTVFYFGNAPASRYQVQHELFHASLKWSAHFVWDRSTGTLTQNSAAWCFVNKEKTWIMRVQATSTDNAIARFIVNQMMPGNTFTPFVAPVNFTPTVCPMFTAVLNQREVVSLIYDGTVDNGTIKAHRNGNLVPVITQGNLGVTTMEGMGYLGCEVTSTSNASDMKGAIGPVLMREGAVTDEMITKIYEFLRNAQS